MSKVKGAFSWKSKSKGASSGESTPTTDQPRGFLSKTKGIFSWKSKPKVISNEPELTEVTTPPVDDAADSRFGSMFAWKSQPKKEPDLEPQKGETSPTDAEIDKILSDHTGSNTKEPGFMSKAKDMFSWKSQPQAAESPKADSDPS